MAIGFVSAGLMTLPQAISVIFGANIGTTMTAQLLAFKLSDYIYPIIFIGFMPVSYTHLCHAGTMHSRVGTDYHDGIPRSAPRVS